ncbi:MAG: hypothetical protein HND27_09220 [Bacteroidetes bacterium]|nr:hypothetical protein [Bacteroidota bacterium]MBV6461724.1 hypothetical protein [Flavobacteriales bacterium]WKZ75127.1 MAG: hypothetical protein QY303_13365 [Vicingaceae bacterium]MCL4815509.1 hypothetical protein [Flavobacteriales bacterium]NOG95943.1 hypothetical protein [Bacteroidota bacterium]
MNKLITLLLVAVLLSSCTSSKKMLMKGRYDAAMQKSARKIKKKPTKIKEIDVFYEAYTTANKQSRERVDFLRKEGNPANNSEIYNQLSMIKSRQELAKSLPAIGINFQFEDIDNELIESKNKAAEYSYARGEQLLQKGDRMNAREAYGEFIKVKGLISNYKDVDEKIKHAQWLGTSNALFMMRNNSGAILPLGFWEEMKKITIKELNTQWINYDNVQDTTKYYDYYIILNIKIIDVGPELVKENTFTESKQVQDGFEYVLDGKGNVKKDSLGNDIKKPKYKTITCTVLEVAQKKVAKVAGTLDYISNSDNQLIKSENVMADTFFDNVVSKIVAGDAAALKPETAKRLGGQPMPFPPDPDMLLRSAATVKDISKNIIWNNKAILK